MTKTRKTLWMAALVIFCAVPAFSQISEGGRPVSFDRLATRAVSAVQMGSVDVLRLLAEDEEEAKVGMPLRFGFPFDVNYDLENSGDWEELPDGGRLWRLRIEAPGAYSINLIYDEFLLPEDARFYLYSADRTMVLGAFTSRNNKSHRRFSTAPVKGDACVLEYYEPSGTVQPGVISIERVVHAYRDLFSWDVAKSVADYGNSGACNNNVNCPEGADWQDDKRAAAMILTAGGYRICSGALVNNVREDFKQYFLTANHCLGGESTWMFMFNYESPGCANQNGPTYMTVSGSIRRANYAASDFALLELSEAIPDSFDIFYSGWSAIDTSADNCVGIHHPSGDIKKISFNNNPVTSTSYGGTSSGNGTHWRVDDWEDGTTEPGSSGSPIFDSNHRIIGQLHGGYASCASITSDWYGKVARSWEGGGSPSTRLRDWLDPDNSGALELDGLDATGVTISADTTQGWVPFDVNFTGGSKYTVAQWIWELGDGDSAYVQSPLHTYSVPGMHDVKLEVVTTAGDTFFRAKADYIIALADSMIAPQIQGVPGAVVEVDIYARNNVPITFFKIPIEYGGALDLALDSFSTAGLRTAYFTDNQFTNIDTGNRRKTLRLRSSTDGSEPELELGAGTIVRLYFSVSGSAQPGQVSSLVMDGYNNNYPGFNGSVMSFEPKLVSGSIEVVGCCQLRGDFDHNGVLDISDLTALVSYFFSLGDPPSCYDEIDMDGNGPVDVSDLTYLVDYFFRGGPALAPCP